MKRLFTLSLLFISFSGCKKAVEKIQEDLIIKAMTDGKWAITTFTEGGNNITMSFAGYSFQYFSDRTVDAIKNGSVEKKGTWDGDASTMTTWATFDGATNPLVLINGAWHIDRSSWTFVEATQTVNGVTKKMRLDKI